MAMPSVDLSSPEAATQEGVAEQLRVMVGTFLVGPNLEAMPLSARLTPLIAAEAKASDCDYVLHFSAKKSGGKKRGPGLFSMASQYGSFIPGLGAMGGMGGAAAAASAMAGLAAAGSIAGTVQPKDIFSLSYQLLQRDKTTPTLAADAQHKASKAGEDVVTPAVKEMATAICNEVLKSQPAAVPPATAPR